MTGSSIILENELRIDDTKVLLDMVKDVLYLKNLYWRKDLNKLYGLYGKKFEKRAL